MKEYRFSIIARNSLRLLLRNRLYLLYSLFFFVLVSYFHVRYQSNISPECHSGVYTLASFIPYMNVYLSSVFYIILLLFLTQGVMGKEEKLDTMDAIYYRPMSNTEYIWGICLGFIYAFGITGIVSLVLAMFIHLFLSDAPFYFPIYLFYWFTLFLPTIIWILGLSLFVQRVVKNRLLSLMISFSYIVIVIFYIRDSLYGLFDFIGVTLPGVWSEITGFSDLISFLLQRGCWLFFGIGMIQLSTFTFHRLSNKCEKSGIRIIRILLFFAVGLVLGINFFIRNEKNFSLRQKYVDVYSKYEEMPKGKMISQDICYKRKDGKIVLDSRLVVQNMAEQDLQEIILYLNPTLDVKSIEVNGSKTVFEKEHQVIRVKETLAIGDSVCIHVMCEGKIDENVCYLDIPQESILKTKYNQYLACRFGKRYIFENDDFTLLIPEVLWYPMVKPPVNPFDPYMLDRDLARYTLRVENLEGKTAVSQGLRSEGEDCVMFSTDYPLYGLSLCIGNFETFTILIDSVDCELNIYKRNKSLLTGVKNVCPEQLSELKEQTEEAMGKSYPYRRFVLTEVPITFASYYRNDRLKSEFIQPEIVFFPERGAGKFQIRDTSMISDWIRNLEKLLLSDDVEDNTFVWKEFFGLSRWNMAELFSKNFQREPNPYQIYPLFFNEIIQFQSKDYPVLNAVCNLILKEKIAELDMDADVFNRAKLDAINYLSHNSLKYALTDRDISLSTMYEIILLKSEEILNYFEWKGIPRDSIRNFILNYIGNNKFESIDIGQLNTDLKKCYGVDWTNYLYLWYTNESIPRFLVKDFSVERVVSKEEEDWTSTIVYFSVFNDSDTDGFIRLQSSSSSFTNTMIHVPWGKIQEPVDIFLYIKAGEGKEVALPVEKSQPYFKLSMGYSANIPDEIVIACNMEEGRPRIDGYERYIDKTFFSKNPNEIIVDNEDDDFRVVNNSSHLRDYFNCKEGDEKYENLVSYVFLNDTWKMLVDNDAYGSVVKSAMFRLVGKGKSCLEWSANLEKEGIYEIFVYIPRVSFKHVLLPQVEYTEIRNRVQVYNVFLGDKEEKVLVDTRNAEGWLSIGKFHGKPGRSVVSLSDEGEPFQIMIGDAVKWVLLEK